MGLEAIMKQEVITAYKNRKITLRETAQLLGLNYWETQKILEQEGIPIIDLNTEEIEKKK
jgi:predicted HTH domain antitoxin